jgi:hypothetical protein
MGGVNEAEPRSADPDRAERRGADPHSADRHSADRHSADRHSADRHSADRHSANRQRAEVAERLRRRYPRSRLPRPVIMVGVGVLAAVGLGWLVWAGLVYATPQVSAQIASYVVKDDRTISIVLTVERRDPSIPATCRVVAQASDFETVGEVEVAVRPGQNTLTNLDTSIVTLRRATTAVAKGCTSGG